MADTFTLHVHSAVVRFDAADKLFIHLTHSPEDPAKVGIGDETFPAPGTDRRAWLVGTGGQQVSGAFPRVADLPRGLVLEVAGYESVTLQDGVLEVVVPEATQKPDWMEAGKLHVFERPGEGLRMWSKSFLPGSDATMVDVGAKASANVRTQGNRARTLVPEKQAPAEAETAAPAATPEVPEASPAAPEKPRPTASKPPSEPYRPDRPPAGSYTADRLQDGKSGGCLGLLVFGLTAGAALLSLSGAGLAALL